MMVNINSCSSIALFNSDILQSAISYRDDIENQIDRTLCDLSLAIAEIAGQYGSERDATSTLRSNRDVGTSKRDSKPLEEAVAIDKSVAFSSTAPLWRSVRGRVDLLHQQWMDARKSCRDAVVAHIEVHPISSKLFCLGGAEHGNAASANHSSSRGSADDKKRKPFMTSLNEEDGEITDSGSKTFLNLSDIGPVSPNKQSARVSSARSVSSIGSRMSTATSQFGGVCKNASAGMVLRPVAPSTIRVYQMLGLRPPKSVMKRDEAMGDDSGAGVELDRHRIFQLQRDLVKFSRAAFQFCNELSDPTIKYSQKQQSVYDASIEIPQAKEACSFEVDSLLDLRHTSQRLLIDTAALAPIAPNNSEFPMASNLSGLDALIVEISEICSKSKHGSKIMQSESLTRAIDRAITEQAALVQCLHFADVHAKAAQNKEKKKKTAMEEFKITVNGVIDRCDVELKSMMEIVRHVIIETGRAENCMVELPTTTNVTKAHRSSKDTHTAVYPLDALSRGFLGAEVAAFVNSIRAFLNNFENIQSCLVTVRKHMKTSILKELEQLLC